MTTGRRCQRYQRRRIVVRSAGTADRHVIASLLCRDGKMALKPPRQGVKPKQTTIQASEKLNEWIPPSNVFDFMRQNGASLYRRPKPPGWRQQNPVPDDPYSDGNGYRSEERRVGKECRS